LAVHLIATPPRRQKKKRYFREGGLIGGKSSKSILPLLSQMMPTKVNMVK
jgi:hypothetical protein